MWHLLDTTSEFDIIAACNFWLHLQLVIFDFICSYLMHAPCIFYCFISTNQCRNMYYLQYNISLNNVRDLTIKFANSSRLKFYTPHCWIPPWSPSKYSPWEAMHRCQRLVHPSKQFWSWFCGMSFRAAVVLLLMSSISSKCLPFDISFIFGNRKKSLEARSGE